MRPGGRPSADNLGDCIEFVPKRDLDHAQQENEHLRQENNRLRRETEQLKQETERLRRELEAALRARQTSGRAAFARHTESQPAAPRPETRPTLWQAGVPPDPRAGGMNGSPFLCRSAVHIVAAAWSGK